MKYTNTAKALLDELLSPLPFLVRPMAKKAMEKDIFAEAEKFGHAVAEDEDVVRGVIIAAKKKGNQTDRMKNFMTSKGIDLSKYADILD